MGTKAVLNSMAVDTVRIVDASVSSEMVMPAHNNPCVLPVSGLVPGCGQGQHGSDT